MVRRSNTWKRKQPIYFFKKKKIGPASRTHMKAMRGTNQKISGQKISLRIRIRTRHVIRIRKKGDPNQNKIFRIHNTDSEYRYRTGTVTIFLKLPF
jgi:hypothetical protein